MIELIFSFFFLIIWGKLPKLNAMMPYLKGRRHEFVYFLSGSFHVTAGENVHLHRFMPKCA